MINKGGEALYLLLFCLFVIAGCSSLERRTESFELTASKYENAVRWGYYELAYDFRKNESTEGTTPDFRKLRDIKVVSYTVLKQEMSEERLEAGQTVEIRYYHINKLIEKTLIDQQLWVYEEDDNKWYLESGFPEFK